MIQPHDLHRVNIEGVPVDVWERARDWFEGLVREFDIIASAADHYSVPRRMVTFVNSAREQFSHFVQTDVILDEALAAGMLELDLNLTLPDAARDAALELWQLIERAEAFCNSGQLLSLAPPGDVRRFVRWYLDEVARQIDGEEPTPWSEVDRSGQ